MLTVDNFPGFGDSEAIRLVGALSPRERQTLDALLEGKSAKEIASLLGVSVRSAENYQSAVPKKLHASTPVDLVRLAMGAGLLPRL